jgi:hypothetical protein
MQWLLEASQGVRPDQRITLTSEPIRSTYSTMGDLRAGDKPAGLWYACGRSWIEWLQWEMPHWGENTNYIYSLHLGSTGILYIKSGGELDLFTEKYKLRLVDMSDREHLLACTFGGYPQQIDWPRVAHDYPGGIEICPYIQSHRLGGGSRWYYGWDVASGCIWGPKTGLTGLTLIAKRTRS